MSKWTEVRDALVDALSVEDVAATAKDQLTTSLATDGMEAIQGVADKFITEIQSQAATESGWSAIRDKIVLPVLISGGLWIAKVVVAKSATTNNKDVQ